MLEINPKFLDKIKKSTLYIFKKLMLGLIILIGFVITIIILDTPKGSRSIDNTTSKYVLFIDQNTKTDIVYFDYYKSNDNSMSLYDNKNNLICTYFLTGNITLSIKLNKSFKE